MRDALKQGLSVVERACARNPSLPILGAIALVAKKNSLELAATDLEIGIRYQLLAETKEEGGTAVPSRLLSQFVGALSEQQIEIDQTKQGLRISSEKYNTLLKTVSLEDFPIIPSLEGSEKKIPVNSQQLSSALAQVVGMAGQGQARPEITGIYFMFQRDTLRLVATDSFRLAEKTIKLSQSQDKEASFILPQKTARELTSILGEQEGSLAVYTSPTQALFDIASQNETKVQVVSRLIEGEYPQYQDVIPKRYASKATVERAELVSQLRAASIFSGKLNDVHVALQPKKKGLELSSRSPEAGEHSSFLSAEVTGDPVEISFNWRFLLDGLLQMKAKEVEIGFGGEEAPAVLKPSASEGYLYVVMPVKA